MSPETDELLQKAMSLPAEERAELASSLIDSLDPTMDEDAEVAWQQEVSRRMDEIKAGKVKTVPWRGVQQKGRHSCTGSNRCEPSRWSFIPVRKKIT